MILDIILYILLGLVSGFTAGLFGLGGGVIIVPGLLWIFLRLRRYFNNILKLLIATLYFLIILPKIIKRGHEEYATYTYTRRTWC